MLKPILAWQAHTKSSSIEKKQRRGDVEVPPNHENFVRHN